MRPARAEGRASGWRRFDTLGLRLFVLMWIALTVSTILGFSAFRWTDVWRGGSPPGPMREQRLPAAPELPPIGLVLDGGPPRMPDALEPGERDPLRDLVREGPGASPPARPPDDRPRERPWVGLWADLLMRMLVVAAFAALGARWLAAPMRRVATAAAGLGSALSRGEPVPQLDVRRGSVEVRDTAAAFNDMAARLQQQFDQRSLYMAALSHDLRTPMTRLRLRLEADGAGAVARHLADLDSMDELIDGVLEALRAERAPETLQPVDLASLLQAMADDLADDGHAVSVGAMPDRLPPARAAPRALRRVLMNLVLNALRHAGSARLSAREAAGRLEVHVDDDGPGIPEAQLDAVCRPYAQLAAEPARAATPGPGPGQATPAPAAPTAPTAGVGLGLYIARELTVRHGGGFSLTNRPEGGLRATVSLPRN